MPKIQAAFVCKSFTKEPGGFLSFNSVAQSVRVPKVPGQFDALALGIYITDLPQDRESSLQVALMGTDSFIELVDGQLKGNIPLKPTADGFRQIAYNITGLVIPTYDAYRFVFSFDGSPEIVHYAPFVVLPLLPAEGDVPDWVRPTPTRH
jgi:hypothetical protein